MHIPGLHPSFPKRSFVFIDILASFLEIWRILSCFPLRQATSCPLLCMLLGGPIVPPGAFSPVGWSGHPHCRSMLPAGLELRPRIQYRILAYPVAFVKRQEVRSSPRPGACTRLPAAHLPNWQGSPFADNTCRRRTEHRGGRLQSHAVWAEWGVAGGSASSQQAMNCSV
jgi:hypothetical protein